MHCVQWSTWHAPAPVFMYPPYTPSPFMIFSPSLLLVALLAHTYVLSLSLFSSIILFFLSFHPHMRQTSRYLLDILRTFAPLRFEFLTRFPSQISLSLCSFRCTRTISSKRCSVIWHGFHGEHGLFFFPPLPLHRCGEARRGGGDKYGTRGNKR